MVLIPLHIGVVLSWTAATDHKCDPQQLEYDNSIMQKYLNMKFAMWLNSNPTTDIGLEI